MTLKKNYPTTPRLTNKQLEEQARRGKVKYRKARQQELEAETEIKEWMEKRIVR